MSLMCVYIINKSFTTLSNKNGESVEERVSMVLCMYYHLTVNKFIGLNLLLLVQLL